jgi:signal transduction histidine kinase
MLQIIEFSDIYVLIDSQWKFYSKFRLSTLLHETPNGWRLLQQHGSLPDMRVGEGETVAVEKISKENLELRDAVKRRTAELESKNRELAIEAALEKVRSRTMAMQSSEELPEVANVMFLEVQALGIPAWSCGYCILLEDKKSSTCIMSSEGTLQKPFLLPHYGEVSFEEWDEFIHGDHVFFTQELSGPAIKSHYDFMKSLPQLGPIFKEIQDAGLSLPEYQINHLCKFDHGFLLFITYEKVPEAHEIFKRFTSIFNQTYTRFLDLQKAEAQALEAQIEAALERVRSASMAMHQTSELREVISTIFGQLKVLNVSLDACYIDIFEPDNWGLNIWVGTEMNTYPEKLTVSYLDHPLFNRTKQARLLKESFFTLRFDKEAKDKLTRHLASESDIVQERLDLMLQGDRVDMSVALSEHAALNVYNYRGRPYSEEQNEIVRRFSRVFEQAYTRFLDLQKAEAQARESQIQLALERVRAQTMAMHSSEDLEKTTEILFEELEKLNLKVERSGIGIFDPETLDCQLYTTVINDHGEKELTSGITSLTIHPMLTATVDAWKSDKPLSYILEGKELDDYYKIIRKGKFPLSDDLIEKSANLPKEFYHYTPFSAGGLYFFSDSEHRNEDKEIMSRFAEVFEMTYTRFLDLQKAEAQAREAQIEAALERVRSRTMGMHKSDELADVADVLFKEMNELVHNLWTCGFVLCEKNREEDEWWLGLEEGFTRGFFLPNVNDFAHSHLYEGWLKGESFRTVQLEGDDLQEHYEWLMEIPVAKNIFDEMEAAGMERPEWQKLHAAYFSKGYLVIITRESCPEEAIFKRFAQVFDLTYTRFLDLQKAEAQARESQIELSLERIRAQVTGMQESSDLLDIVVTMRTEFVNLGHEAHYFWHMRWLPDTYKKAMTSGDGTKIGMVMTLPRHIHGDIQAVAAWEKTKDPIHVLAMDVDTAVDYVDKMISLGDFERVDPQAPSLDDIRHIGGLTFVMARTTHGEIGFSLPGVVPDPPEDAVDTLIRFAGVFDLAYRRFEDLKKAESQARENRIELALERTRNQSMLMQHSDEIKGISDVFHQQLLELNIPTEFSYVWLPDESKNNHQFWASWAENKKGKLTFSSKQVTYPLDKTEPYTAACYKAWEDQENVHIEFIKPDEIPDFFSTWAELLDGAKNLKAQNFSEGIYYAEAYMRYGCFGINIRRELTEQEKQVLKRFSIEFERAYTRFLDLQKAEKQAQEAQVELSLERIRAQVTSMKESTDLFDIVVGMRKEFISLGHESDYFWHMRWLPEVYEMSMTSEDGNRLGMVIQVPKVVHDQIDALAEWEKSDDPIFVLPLNAKDAWDYLENMNTYGHYEKADPNAPTQEDIEHIGGLTFIIARTTHGEIGYSLPGMVPHPPKEALDTLVRFAAVFDLAYKRFEDLKTAEKDLIEIKRARQKAEDALIELKATQTQLVQQEKLASLGQLTAGIAHEIKNPLNFVNNFSEVSLELIEEALEEIKEIKENEHATDASEILEDVQFNLKKIHEHGTRANGIVSSMLQHSRGGSGKMEPTDLNALIKEYVNLSFHGMRAGKNPINVKLDFDLDENIGQVNLIGEDFSRVVLNLANNAFDAMREKVKSATDYLPKLSVKTERKSNDELRINISDNGPGIPKEIKDKILQPFFTTKKGTEGTGLGLSITNDIVKAHGGELEVQSEIGKGTTFTIQLKD